MKPSRIDDVTDVTHRIDIALRRTRAHGRDELPKPSVTSVTPADDGSRRDGPPERLLGGKLSDYDAEAVKRYGWRDQMILVVSVEDHRLTWLERELVRQLGSKLYGRPSNRRSAFDHEEGA